MMNTIKPAAQPTQRIANRYDIEAFIARGGMGVVYRARDTQTGQLVAIKHLLQSAIPDADAWLERFTREGQALRLLNHPNIVALLDTVQENNEHYLVMEYVSGGTLADLLLKQPRLSVERVIQIGLDVSDALTRAHRLKIIHRDLKPANVLLSADGTPRLTDFGVAHLGGERPVTESGMIIGTVAYMSPEMLNGEPLDARADIWAFGVLLFELLTGQRPFVGEPLSAQITAILTARVPDLEALRPDAPAAWVDLIYRMLDKDKLARIGSMRQVGAELEALLTDKGDNDKAAPTHIIQRAAQSGPSAIPDTTPPPTSTTAASSAFIPNNLPTQTTPFVGREEECAELGKLLADPVVRLITILGPGGMGKTRLSLEVAAAQRANTPEHFPDGIFFTELAPLTASDLLVPAVAESVHFQFYQGGTARQQLLDFFREKQLLLVLDNFEHLVDGADFVADLLQAAPGVKVIATSRERLNLQAETLFRLEGMNFPDWETPADALEYSAVQLFVQSAKRAQPRFALTSEQLPSVARICGLVRGLPLGIVLAAAWVDSLSLAEIGEEIGKSVDFLETEARDVPTRQRSMRAVFDYSWNLLTAEERAAFAQLSVFRGGFTRDAAQFVTGASLRTLTGLVNKSLLRRAPDGRYEVHELLRQYAEHKLSEDAARDAATRDQHCLYYSEVLERQTPRLKNHEQTEAIRVIEAEMDNIRVGVERGVERQDLDALNRCWEALILFYLRYAQNESSLRLFQITADSLRLAPRGFKPGLEQLLGIVLGACGFFKAYIGQREAAIRDFDEAEALLRSVQPLPARELALLQLCHVLPKVLVEEPLNENNQRSLERLQDGLTLAESINDQWLVATIDSMLAWVHNALGDYRSSIGFTQRSLATMQALGDEIGQVASWFSLGWGAVHRGEYEQAKATFIKISTTHRKYKAVRPLGYALLSLSDVALHTNDLSLARENILEAAGHFKQTGDQRGVIISLSNLARIAEQEGHLPEAKRLFDEVVSKARQHGNAALLAASLNGLARIEAALVLDFDARRNWQEALRLALDAEAIRVALEALFGLAGLFAKVGEQALAVQILSHIETNAAVVNEVRQAAQTQLAALREVLAAEVFAAAFQHGAALDLKTVADLGMAPG